MSVRKPALDPTTAELARRRLRQLGAELSPVEPVPADPVPSDPVPADPVPGRPGPPGRHARQRLQTVSRVCGRLGDALPPTLQGRLHVTAQHVTVVALALAAAMALAAWLLVRSAPEAPPAARQASLQLPVAQASVVETPVVEAPVVEASGAPAPVAPAPVTPAPVAAQSASAELVVHVVGKVRRPGVVELPGGARVVDAIEAAGGAKGGARLGSLNLARLVVDGEQIAVGVPGAVIGVSAPTVPEVPVTSGGAPSALVDLNTATQAELEELPGVGPVTATSIMEWRTEHGGFSTVDELLEVSGIGEVTLGELRDLVTV